jgi:hypothetical protein
MKIAIDSTYHKTPKVGTSTTFDVDIQDVGTADIPNVYLAFNLGTDRFLDIYSVESAGPCQVDTNVPGLACGKLTQGAHLTFTIKATPKTAGSYVFKFTVNQYKTILSQDDGEQYDYTWTQTISS